MKLLCPLCCLLAITAAALAQADDRFVALFDGTSLDGWKHNGNWTIDESGALYCDSRGGDIEFTSYPVPDDFELLFEWKVVEGANSGVYYRPGQYEYQVLHNGLHRDGKSPRSSAAALYFCMAPSHDATRPLDQWNEGRIVCKGTVIQHWLNGQRVVDFDYADPRYAANVGLLRLRGGNLADRGANLRLQDHGDPVWFRNIRLREIPADEPVECTHVVPAPIPAEALFYEQQVIQRHTRPKPPPAPRGN